MQISPQMDISLPATHVGANELQGCRATSRIDLGAKWRIEPPRLQAAPPPGLAAPLGAPSFRAACAKLLQALLFFKVTGISKLPQPKVARSEVCGLLQTRGAEL